MERQLQITQGSMSGRQRSCVSLMKIAQYCTQY